MNATYRNGDRIMQGDLVENDDIGKAVVVMVLESNTILAESFGCKDLGGVLLHSCEDGLQLWTKGYDEWCLLKRGGLKVNAK